MRGTSDNPRNSEGAIKATALAAQRLWLHLTTFVQD